MGQTQETSQEPKDLGKDPKGEGNEKGAEVKQCLVEKKTTHQKDLEQGQQYTKIQSGFHPGEIVERDFKNGGEIKFRKRLPPV